MKKHIDTVVEAILASLARSSNEPQIEAILAAHGKDGISLAREQRAALEGWADDLTLSEEDRAYAAEQLNLLPDF